MNQPQTKMNVRKEEKKQNKFLFKGSVSNILITKPRAIQKSPERLYDKKDHRLVAQWTFLQTKLS